MTYLSYCPASPPLSWALQRIDWLLCLVYFFVCQHAYVRVALRGASVVSVVASATTVSIDMGSIGGEMSAGWKWLLAVVPSVVPLCTVRAATIN